VVLRGERFTIVIAWYGQPTESRLALDPSLAQTPKTAKPIPMHEKSSNQRVGSEMMVRWPAESAQLSVGTPDGSDMGQAMLAGIDLPALGYRVTQHQVIGHATHFVRSR
jgi:hypothetical protein